MLACQQKSQVRSSVIKVLYTCMFVCCISNLNLAYSKEAYSMFRSDLQFHRQHICHKNLSESEKRERLY